PPDNGSRGSAFFGSGEVAVFGPAALIFGGFSKIKGEASNPSYLPRPIPRRPLRHVFPGQVAVPRSRRTRGRRARAPRRRRAAGPGGGRAPFGSPACRGRAPARAPRRGRAP